MNEWICQLTDAHERMLDHLDQALMPFVEIRDQKRPVPADPNEAAEEFLHWTQREFLPHLQEEQDLCRPLLQATVQGEGLYQEMMAQHEKLRALAHQAREEIVLLLNQDSIREAWWDTLEMSSLWAFRRTLSEHIDHEHRDIFPKALALTAASQ